jgi:hypothetical protein
MQNIVDVKYNTTGQSTKVNSLGMREMQAKAYEARNSQYILLKAPPASGKSRALMFLGLDKKLGMAHFAIWGSRLRNFACTQTVMRNKWS